MMTLRFRGHSETTHSEENSMAQIGFSVDGAAGTVDVDPNMPVLYALRDDLKMKNPHFGCGLAQCGACTVHLVGGVCR